MNNQQNAFSTLGLLGGNTNGGFQADFGGGLQQPAAFATGLSNGFTDNVSMIQKNYDFGMPSIDTDLKGAITIEIRKVYLGLTRPQGEQHRRSYDVMLDGNGLRNIENEVERNGVEAFNPLNMSKLMATTSLIKHSGTADAQIGIDNGWREDRFRFTMVVDVFRNGRFNRTEFISGHTDHAGVSNAGLISTVAIDPNMVFTINHVTEARQRQLDNMGNPVALVSRSNGVVRNNAFGGLSNLNQSLYMTRPSDVLRAVDKVALYSGMQQAQAMGDAPPITYQDLDSVLTGIPMMAADTTMLLPTFASRTLKGLYENSLTEFDPMNMDGMGSGSMASQRVQDTAFSVSGFVHVMNRKLANSVTNTAQFRYADLLMLDPTIDDRADVFGRSYESGAVVIPHGTDVHSLGSAETIALHATSISQSVLALMSMAGVATLAFNANNMKTGQTELTFQACDGMDHDGMLSQRLENLRTRMVLECLNIVTMNDEYTFELDVFADAFNDVYVQLVWDGIRRDYVIPAFASSSLAPIVTNDLNRLTGMAEAISSVVETCKQLINPGAHNSSNSNIIVGDGNTRYAGLAGDY